MNNIDEEKVLQIKLVNGQEFLAVCNSPSAIADDSMVEVSHALDMVPTEYVDEEGENRAYYVLRPFVSYTEDLSTTTSINPSTVICMSVPGSNILEQYISSVDHIQEMLASQNDSDEGLGGTPEGNVVSINFPSKKKLLTED